VADNANPFRLPHPKRCTCNLCAIPATLGRDPARQEIVPGLWSIAVPGAIRGTMVRAQLTTGDPARAVADVAAFELHTARGTRELVELSVRELRALLNVIGEWPGVRS
jgi:hypothetical protein